MEKRFFNAAQGKMNVKELEKALGYKLLDVEKEYARYYYENGGTGLPRFDTEEYLDFRALYCGE